MKYLPTLSEALEWCSKAGVNKDWGGYEFSPENHFDLVDSIHKRTNTLETIKKIVIHRSGFTCGNASLFRWYHRVVNRWRDIGYHLVIGNGHHDYSVAGTVESGRPINRVSDYDNSKNTLLVCLIDSRDHFKSIPPSSIEFHSLENALLYLLGKADNQCEIITHFSLSPDSCPGIEAHLEEVIRKAKLRKDKMRHQESSSYTIDLRYPFKSGLVDWKNPQSGIDKVKELGFSRIVYPYHWLIHPWENTDIAKKWVQYAHENNMDVLLYTGPFGTELRKIFKDNPIRMDWLQRKANGSEVTFDESGCLYMFCPSSPYLKYYRLPFIETFIEKTDCDGIFFDIPWIIEDACFCEMCKKTKIENNLLELKELSIRNALSETVLKLRNQFPKIWLSANIAAPCVWDSKERGATPVSLNGLFDELITEWTPKTIEEIELIKKSINYVRAICPTSRISHAWVPEKCININNIVCEALAQQGAGRWHVR